MLLTFFMDIYSGPRPFIDATAGLGGFIEYRIAYLKDKISLDVGLYESIHVPLCSSECIHTDFKRLSPVSSSAPYDKPTVPGSVPFYASPPPTHAIPTFLKELLLVGIVKPQILCKDVQHIFCIIRIVV